MNGKVARKHSLDGKIATSVLFQLFISDMSGTLFTNVSNLQSMNSMTRKI